jgi:ribose 5-phosphate isomerase B
MIYIGADHGGYDLKEKIKAHLTARKIKFKDIGNSVYEKEDDYPDYAFKVAEAVSREPSPDWNKSGKGILLCRSSFGMIIAANKVKGIKAASVYDIESAVKSREHNDANIIALSGDHIKEDDAEKIVDAWLKTEFSGEKRHMRRIKKIEEYENA